MNKRETEMIECLKPEIASLLKRSQPIIEKRYFDNKEIIDAELYDMLCPMIDYALKRDNAEKIFLNISTLMSSVITHTYQLELAVSNEWLYSDREARVSYWTPSFIFSSLDDDLDYLVKKIKEKFVRVKEYEVDELRYWYCKYYFAITERFFAYFLKGLFEKYDQLSKTITILYGGYIDYKKQILV